MRKIGTFFPIFQSLPRDIRRAQENLYSARQGLSDETCDTINRFPEIIRNNQFEINPVTFDIDSVFGEEPTTPPFQNLNSEDENLPFGELYSNSFTEVGLLNLKTTKVFNQLLLKLHVFLLQTLICPLIRTCPIVMKIMKM
jgi:hypothetical protein